MAPDGAEKSNMGLDLLEDLLWVPYKMLPNLTLAPTLVVIPGEPPDTPPDVDASNWMNFVVDNDIFWLPTVLRNGKHHPVRPCDFHGLIMMECKFTPSGARQKVEEGISKILARVISAKWVAFCLQCYLEGGLEFEFHNDKKKHFTISHAGASLMDYRDYVLKYERELVHNAWAGNGRMENKNDS